MNPPSLQPIGIQFGAIVVVVAALLVAMLRGGAARAGMAAPARRRLLTLAIAAIAAWLGLTALLARAGILLDFTSTPPKLMLVVVPALVAAVALGVSGALDGPLAGMPAAWPIAAQAFRIPVEFGLLALYREGAIARMMTFEGQNFDLLTGLTAPLVAWLCFGGGRARRGLAIAWNVCGLLLLANVTLHGLLSAPTRFQYFHTDPPNTIVARFPFVWLPAFLVPMALLFHLLSLRRISSRFMRRPDAPARG